MYGLITFYIEPPFFVDLLTGCVLVLVVICMIGNLDVMYIVDLHDISRINSQVFIL